MRPASVGFQCPECVREGQRGQRQPRTVLGGRLSGATAQVTVTLIAINVVMYILQQVIPGFTVRFALIGQAYDPASQSVIGVAAGEPYRLLTAAFLHASVFHILFNMYALFIVGPVLESAFGRLRFTALYLLSAVGGSAASYLISSPGQLGLGASGAVFGLFGAYFVLARRLRLDTRAIVAIVAINLVLGFVLTNVDWRAHIGGLVTGTLFALALAHAPPSRRTILQMAAGVGLLIVVVVIVAARTASLAG